MDEAQELLDLVDANDQKVGTILRGDYDRLEAENLGYIRSSNAFIVNSSGQLWVPKRAAHKRIFPNGLDFSVAEHVQSGETYFDACLRGFREELQVDVDPQQLEFLAIVKPHSGLRYFEALYLIHSDEVPNYNHKDFSSFEWLTPEEVVRSIDAGTPAKRDLKFLVCVLQLFM